MKSDYYCGLSFYHPKWLQKFANAKMFMAVYGLLGTVQAMSFMYFLVTLTTVEKRFQTPSQTTGIMLSGNEISQILFSLLLSYTGGQRNRPRWIAWGMIFCAISCFILALPHFIYGPGEQSIQLTQEFLDSIGYNNYTFQYFNGTSTQKSRPNNVCKGNTIKNECGDIVSIIPLILIFLSQFVLGIGNTLYYSLGQTYLDDNTKKKNTPLMLAFAMSLRMIGPVFGFFLGFICLNLFIDFTRTPLIDKDDPKWLGAWWFGWIILGSIMLLFSGLIGLFPKKLHKEFNANTSRNVDEIPKVLQNNNILDEVFQSSNALDLDKTKFSSTIEIPQLSDFRTALLRLLKNHLLIFNIISAIFYIFSASGFMTFATKYIEVQFQKSAQYATILVGPLAILGTVFGLLASGFIISQKKPSPSKVLFWNIIVGFVYVLGQIFYLFLYCSEPENLIQYSNVNLTTPCNVDCNCANVSYNPVCDSSTQTTYFSPCHAGCQLWDSKNKNYNICYCINNKNSTKSTVLPFIDDITESNEIVSTTKLSNTKSFNYVKPGKCLQECVISYYIFAVVALIVNLFGSSGKIGSILVNYRAVSTQDKSFAQGLALTLISLFALIPGPIIFGRVIDSTCLVWANKCGVLGNCQLYNQTQFRYKINTMAICLTVLGIFFDVLVWYYGKKLDFYGEREQAQLEKNKSTRLLLLAKSTKS